MSPLHVAFAAKSVELLCKRPTLTGPELIELWNQEYEKGSITVETTRHGRGHRASKKAAISLITATLKCRNYI
jgi:hypothetical protein